MKKLTDEHLNFLSGWIQQFEENEAPALAAGIIHALIAEAQEGRKQVEIAVAPEHLYRCPRCDANCPLVPYVNNYCSSCGISVKWTRWDGRLSRSAM